MNIVLYILAFLQVVLMVISSLIPFHYTSSEISIDDIKYHVRFLSDDSLKGRFPDTEGSHAVQRWIVQFYKLKGLYPVFENQYLQEFEFEAEYTKKEKNSILIKDCNQNCELLIEPLTLGPSKEISGNLLFGNYCLQNDLEELQKNLEFQEKKENKKDYIIVCKRFGPEGVSDKQIISFESKYKNIEKFHFAGVVFLKEKGESISVSNYFPYRGFIPAAFLPSNEEVLIEYAKNKKEVTLITSYDRIKRKGKNIAASLKPWKPGQKVILIGAHYDHLGYGIPQFSLGPIGEIYNGADDNASGTAAVMELAEFLQSEFQKNNEVFKDYNIIFLHFDVEEWGLFGSEFFVKSKFFTESKPIAMLNFDMVGRLNETLFLQGKDTGDDVWKRIIESSIQKGSLKNSIKFMEGGLGPSDHAVFYRSRMPVLFFFTGVHKDYHKPTDDYDKLNFNGIKEIVYLGKEIVNNLINSKEIPAYRYTPERSTSAFRYRVRLGIVPANYYLTNGIEVGGFVKGAPIAKSGISVGDIIVQIENYPIHSIEDLMSFLNEAQTGKQYKIKFKRKDKILETYTELMSSQ